MRNTFFVSDTHFGHANILTFRGDDGELIRPFASVDYMDELMIERWNEVVRDGDLVYHLGDVGWNRKVMRAVMPRLNGTKRLILGNHDDIHDHELLHYFQDVMLWKRFRDEGFLCSHVPLPNEQMFRSPINVHGHIHERPDPSWRHVNICVEQTDYRPLALEDVAATVRKRRELADSNPSL